MLFASWRVESNSIRGNYRKLCTNADEQGEEPQNTAKEKDFRSGRGRGTNYIWLWPSAPGCACFYGCTKLYTERWTRVRLDLLDFQRWIGCWYIYKQETVHAARLKAQVQGLVKPKNAKHVFMCSYSFMFCCLSVFWSIKERRAERERIASTAPLLLLIKLSGRLGRCLHG